MIALGDAHNFGRRVSLANDGTIFKPRTIAWERLFLGACSPLRAHISQLAARDGIPSPVAVTPVLEFKSSDGDRTGNVQKLEFFTPDAKHFSHAAFREIGSALAYTLWFGMSDLHNANIVFGTSPAGSLVFGPVDVECVFQQSYLLSQAQLVPTSEMRPEDGGLVKVLNFMREYSSPELIAALCLGLLEGVSFFERHDRALMAHFEGKDLADQHVRLILRNTRSYYSFAKDGIEPTDLPLAVSERVQLSRGDIPYFFRRFSKSEVLYYSSEQRFEPAELPVERFERALALARIPGEEGFSPRKSVLELRFAALQAARYFDPGTGSAVYASGDVTVEYKGAELFVKWGDALAVGSKRVAGALGAA